MSRGRIEALAAVALIVAMFGIAAAPAAPVVGAPLFLLGGASLAWFAFGPESLWPRANRTKQ